VTSGPRGFSLIELLLATGITLTVVATVFAMLAPGGPMFGGQSEMADMQQRVRVAAETLAADLEMAGSGPSRGRRAGPLRSFLAPVLPYAIGPGGDAPGAFRADVLTVVYLPEAAAESVLALATSAVSARVSIASGPGCPLNDASCGFAAGGRVIIYDDSGAFDVYAITRVAGPLLDLRHETPDSPHVYPQGSTIAEAVVRTYARRVDPATAVDQLVRIEGGRTVPVVDHVVDLSFDYVGDAAPPRLVGALGSIGATTYGPPPALVLDEDGHETAGENCVLASADGGVTPRLGWLAPSGTDVVALSAAQLTDGPWCPDPLHPNRFDADLLRVRGVGVRLTVEAAMASRRGPAGRMFSRGGTAADGPTLAPDLIAGFFVTSRNRDPGR
jgi:type II secretory pathway pseudopilin PulG